MTKHSDATDGGGLNDLERTFEALQKSKGVSFNTLLGTVRAADFQKFAYTVGDITDRYFRDAEPEAPPLYVSSVMGWTAGPLEHELRIDGSDPAATAAMPLGGRSLMGVGQELEFHRGVIDGDELRVVVRIHDVVLKSGRSGQLILLTIDRDYVDAEGDVVLSCRESVVVR